MLHVKVLVGALNQEEALVGAFSDIVKTLACRSNVLHSTHQQIHSSPGLGVAAAVLTSTIAQSLVNMSWYINISLRSYQAV